jgi:hypothetical protein
MILDRRRYVPSSHYFKNAVGAHFDGTNDHLNLERSSATANSTRHVISFWFNVTGGIGTNRYFGQATSSRWYTRLDSANTLTIQFRDTSGVINWLWTTNATFTSSGWHHIFAYIDTTSAGDSILYVDGIADVGSPTIQIESVMRTGAKNWAIGAMVGGSGNSAFPGDLAEFWMGDPGRVVTALDLLSFISNGKPRNLGLQGEIPFNIQPSFYLQGNNTAFHINSGSAGDFTLTGALTSITPPIQL